MESLRLKTFSYLLEGTLLLIDTPQSYLCFTLVSSPAAFMDLDLHLLWSHLLSGLGAPHLAFTNSSPLCYQSPQTRSSLLVVNLALYYSMYKL